MTLRSLGIGISAEGSGSLKSYIPLPRRPPVIESIVEAGTGLVSTYGLVVLFVVFVLEGALVGKLIPSRALFVAAILMLGADLGALASVAAAAVIGASVGQLGVFLLIRRTSFTTEQLPGSDAGDGQSRAVSWIDRWGITAVAVSNVLPVVRGTLTVPVAMGETSMTRFSSAAVLGTAVYVCGLVVLALGIEAVVPVA